MFSSVKNAFIDHVTLTFGLSGFQPKTILFLGYLANATKNNPTEQQAATHDNTVQEYNEPASTHKH